MDNRFFLNNRRRLSEILGPRLVVLSAYKKMQAVGDAVHPFSQEANFWYLSGIEHPDWLLIIDGAQGRSWLVAPEVDAVHQVFDGSLTIQDAKDLSGVDEVVSQKGGEELLRNLAKKHAVVYAVGRPKYAKYADFSLNPAAEILKLRLGKIFGEVKDCQEELAKLRAIKQPEEITAIKAAADISVEAFKRAKAKLASSRHEFEVEAELAYVFRRQNALHAFEPIVASGRNACTLHYTANSGVIAATELLLIDAGARLGSYAADITRTFAIGSPSTRQAEVHEAVRQAQAEIVGLIRPGGRVSDYVAEADAVMKNALSSLGLAKGTKDGEALRRYMPHAISHGLGTEVHEGLGGYKEFKPGMVLTVEPGIYIPEEGIGVRIEDDILVTETGIENLTVGVSTGL